MATAEQVIKASLQRILVQASEAPLEADEYQDAIFAMNNLMLAYDADGIDLGYTEVSNISNPVTIPTGALRGLIANLAIEVAPDYGGEITAGLSIAAAAGLKTMRRLARNLQRTAHPSTLPIGSGNFGGWPRTNRFYPGADETEILAETTGSILLEQNTNEVADGS